MRCKWRREKQGCGYLDGIQNVQHWRQSISAGFIGLWRLSYSDRGATLGCHTTSHRRLAWKIHVLHLSTPCSSSFIPYFPSLRLSVIFPSHSHKSQTLVALSDSKINYSVDPCRGVIFTIQIRDPSTAYFLCLAMTVSFSIHRWGHTAYVVCSILSVSLSCRL